MTTTMPVVEPDAIFDADGSLVETLTPAAPGLWARSNAWWVANPGWSMTGFGVASWAFATSAGWNIATGKTDIATFATAPALLALGLAISEAVRWAKADDVSAGQEAV